MNDPLSPADALAAILAGRTDLDLGRWEALRAAVAPLAADASAEPSAAVLAALDQRLLAARLGPRPEPVAPRSRAGRWWRADAFVAAAALLMACAILTSGLAKARERHAQLACQNNLHGMYAALTAYADNHGGALPRVGDRVVMVGDLLPDLQRAGAIPDTVRVACPQALPLDANTAYAYNLGYRHGGTIQGIRFGITEAGMPLVSDRPTPSRRPGFPAPDHGRGVNVLFVGGQVRFCTTSRVGIGGDDIFLNDEREVAAGLHPADAALGVGCDRP